MINDEEIVTSVKEESDPVDDETDEYVDNNNNENCYGVVRTIIRVLSYSTTAAQKTQRPCSKKTKV
ncbi:UNVERIFIED_CONTAM: hypothetical protein NCL1_57570 [Trichonephila clavipes]